MNALISFLFLAASMLLLTTGCTTPQVNGQSLADAAVFEFTLRTGMVDGRMAFIGVGGDIDGLANPGLPVAAGEVVHITLINDDGMIHDLAIPDLDVQTAPTSRRQSAVDVTFTPRDGGAHAYICTVSGHRQAGMEGSLIVAPAD